MQLLELTLPNNEKLESFLYQKGFKKLGRGAYGIVYEHPNFDYILKIFTKDDIAFKTFIEKKPNLKSFPKVIGKLIKFNDNTYAIRMEKLSKFSKLFSEMRKIGILIDILYDIRKGKTKEEIHAKINTVQYHAGDNKKEYNEVFEFIYSKTDIVKAMKFIDTLPFKYDIHPGNVMFRGETPVLIDPVSTENAKELQTTPEVEDATAEELFFYVTEVLKKRWIKAEQKIMQDPTLAVLYAEEMIKGRWEKAEPYIMKDPYQAFLYSKLILEQPWKEAEDNIKKNRRVWDSYKKWWNINESKQLNELTRPRTHNLHTFLTSKGFKSIGAGYFSFVFTHPNFNYVLKIFTQNDTAYLDFLKNKPNLKCFPKIIGKPIKINEETYMVRLEKLKEYSSLFSEYKDKVSLCDEITEQILSQNKNQNHFLNKEKLEFLRNKTDIYQGIEYISRTGYIPDVHSENLMFRGEYPVIIDPFFDPSTMPEKIFSIAPK